MKIWMLANEMRHMTLGDEKLWLKDRYSFVPNDEAGGKRYMKTVCDAF